MRILIITSYYHPVQTPNVYRWSAIAQQWTSQGHEVHILCTQRIGIPNYTQEKGVYVHRVGHNTLMDWLYNLLNIQNRRAEAGSTVSRKGNTLKKVLEWVIDWTWRSIYWPDGNCLWYRPATRYLRKAKHPQWDGIVSVGLPFTAHLIGWKAKNLFPETTWLVDIEDPFCYSKAFFVNNFFLYQRLNEKVERQLFRDADQISVTVEAARQKYIQLFPEFASKIQITPPLFSSTSTTFAPKTQPTSRSKIAIGYFGAFYNNIRTPKAFLELLRCVQSIEPNFLEQYHFHFFGRLEREAIDFFNQYPELDPFISLHGLIPRQDAEQKMWEMDFLLNISNKTTYHLPSKSADYLMTGKPIINICYEEQDTFKEFFKTYPLIIHLNLKNDKVTESPAKRFVHFLKHFKNHSVENQIIKKMSTPYQLDVISAKYLQYLTK